MLRYDILKNHPEALRALTDLSLGNLKTCMSASCRFGKKRNEDVCADRVGSGRWEWGVPPSWTGRPTCS